MKKRIFQIILLPTIMCTLFGVGLLSPAGVAHAAPVEAHHPQQAFLNCASGWVEFDTTSGGDKCISGGPFTWYGDEYNVDLISTGNWTVSWNWIDCHGAIHSSTKGPHTITTAQNTPGGFAGCSYMYDVYYINVS